RRRPRAGPRPRAARVGACRCPRPGASTGVCPPSRRSTPARAGAAEMSQQPGTLATSMSDQQPFRHATTAADVHAWLAATSGVRMVAVDTETAGWDPLRDELLLVQVSAGPAHPVLV